MENEPIITQHEASRAHRIQVVLAEQRQTSKGLAEQPGKGEATIHQWRSHHGQTSLVTLVERARVLQVDVKVPLLSTVGDQSMVYSVNGYIQIKNFTEYPLKVLNWRVTFGDHFVNLRDFVKQIHQVISATA